MNFITETFTIKVKDIIRNLFKNLNNTDFNYITSKTLIIINHLQIVIILKMKICIIDNF